MDEKKKKFSETRVGLFLEKIAKGKFAKSVPELITGDVLGFVKGLLKDDDELTDAQREYALKLIELDIKDMDGVTKRWVADSRSDSWLSKNVRPATLVFMNIVLLLLVLMDSFDMGFSVSTEWIDLYKSLALSVFVAYFGARAYEKTKKL